MVLGGGWPGGLQESGRRGPVERFAGLKTRIGNLDAETEIRFRFGRGKRGVGGGRVEKEGREGGGGRGGVAAGRQSIVGGRHGCGATCGGQQCRRRDTVVASKEREFHLEKNLVK